MSNLELDPNLVDVAEAAEAVRRLVERADNPNSSAGPGLIKFAAVLAWQAEQRRQERLTAPDPVSKVEEFKRLIGRQDSNKAKEAGLPELPNDVLDETDGVDVGQQTRYDIIVASDLLSRLLDPDDE